MQASARAGIQSRSRWGRRPDTAGAEGALRLSPEAGLGSLTHWRSPRDPSRRCDCRAGPGRLSVILKGCISPCLNFWGPPSNNAPLE